MAQIIVTVPDSKAPHVIESLSARWGYDQLVLNEGQTQPTKQQFITHTLTEYVKSETKAHDAATAASEAIGEVPDPF